MQTARYIPPTVEDMKIAMNGLGKFINDYDMDILLKIALSDYQFETIHPFLDGNGRIGRMLITLMLLSGEELHKPVLHLSLCLKANRIEYYDRLSEARKKGNYEQWIKFFLSGIIQTCDDAIKTIGELNKLVKSDEDKIDKKTVLFLKVFDYIKKHPLITIGKIAKDLGVSYNGVPS